MEHKRIMAALACVLAAACILVGVMLVSVISRMEYLPDSAVEDLIEVLDAAGIDSALIPTRRQSAPVYVCNSGDYNRTVAALLTGSGTARTYATPDGEILVMENGARLDFGHDFAVRYTADGSEPADLSDMLTAGRAVSDAAFSLAAKTVSRFLESGSRAFEGGGSLKVETSVDEVRERGGDLYALCTRRIDGAQITGNEVVCRIEGDVVTACSGSWVFLTSAESYSAQLSDLVNILFHMKGEIGDLGDGRTRVEAISLCYSLYPYGEEEDFCLIPCWRIRTDTEGEFIYNALDAALYTRK